MSDTDDEGYNDLKFEDEVDSDYNASDRSRDASDYGQDNLLTKELTRSTVENLATYNEAYRELFNGTVNGHDELEVFDESQLGSVIWSAEEKTAFFQVLASKGRHDLPSIAQHIGTKSVLEVRDYLMRIQDAFIERQKFEKYTKAVSTAEIEAAVEISPELEALLEDAADTLANTQNRYDDAQAANSLRSNGPWIYDARTAQASSQQFDLQAASNDEDIATNAAGNLVQASELFDVEAMLELSRSLFMNTAQDSAHDHWFDLADETYPEPMIFAEALETLYTLVRSFTQRVLHSAIFLAKSRIRAISASQTGPRALLRETDVTAALDVLGAPRDSFTHWAGFPRRSGVRVYLGKYERGKHGQRPLTAQEIDNVLSIRAIRGRRRSLSSLVSMSSQDSEGNGAEDFDASEQLHGQTQADGQVDDDTDGSRYAESDTASESEDSNTGLSESTESDLGVIDELPDGREKGHKRSYADVGNEEDRFLDSLDHTVNLREERHLRSLLGLPDLPEDVSDEHLGKRPKLARKTKDELLDWTDFVYPKGWELPVLQAPDETLQDRS